MPIYTIKDAATGTEVDVEGDAPPSEKQMADIFASVSPSAKAAEPVDSRPAFAATPYGVGGGVSVKTPGPEVAANVARYGLPIAAGLATGGVGFIPAALATAAAGATGELGAQAMEMGAGQRENISKRDVAAGAVFNAVAPLKLAKPIASFAANAGANVLAGEGGRAVSEQGWQAPDSVRDVLVRFGLPTVFGGISAAASAQAQKIGAARQEAFNVASERFGDVSGVLPSEVLKDPSITALEQRLFKANVSSISNRLDGLDVPISQQVQALFHGVTVPDEIMAGKFTPMLGQAEELRKIAESAKAEAMAASERATQAKATLGDKMNRTDVVDAANTAAINAVKQEALYTKVHDALFQGALPTISELAPARRLEQASEQANVFHQAYRQAQNRMYDAIGLTPTDAMLDAASFFDGLSRAAKDSKGLLSGSKALEKVRDEANKFFRDPAYLTPDRYLTREGFLSFKDSVAKTLSEDGAFANRANEIASEAYDVLKKASDKFVENSYGSDIAAKLKKANEVSARVFSTRGAQAVEMVKDGKFDEFVNLLEKQGVGYGLETRKNYAQGVMSQMEDYVKSIVGTGDPGALAAAEMFKKNINIGIRESLLSSSLHAGTGMEGARIYDMPKLVKRLQSLSSNGFDVAQLGMGSVEDIGKAARIASTLSDGGLTTAELSKFADDVASFGGTKAAVNLELHRHARDYLVARFADDRRMLAQKLDMVRKTTSDQKAAENALNQATSDPLVQFLSTTNMGLSKDPAKNTRWVGDLVNSGESVVLDFAQALKNSGRSSDLNSLRMAAKVRILSDYQKVASRDTARISTENIADLFLNPKNAQKVASVRALLGEDFSPFYERFIKPIASIAERRELIKGAMVGSEAALNVSVPAGLVGMAQRKTTGGFVVGQYLNRAKTFIDTQRWHALDLLYVNPYWSRRFEQAAFDVSKFSNNVANATALRLANELDQQAQGEPRQ